MIFGRIAVGLIFAGICRFAYAGPFGLEMGMSLKDIDPAAKQAAVGVYTTTRVPKVHSAFETYVLKFSPTTGLCWVKAIGKTIPTSAYGVELQSAFSEMRGKLEANYGKGRVMDLLMPGSIWKEPNEFMMAMLKRERILAASWEVSKGASLSDNLTEIGLIASPLNTDKGYLAIEYSFSNEKSCVKELAAREDSAL